MNGILVFSTRTRSPSPQVIQNLSQFHLRFLCERGADAHGELDADVEVIQGTQLGQDFGSKPVPDFGRHGAGKPEGCFALVGSRLGELALGRV